MSLNPYRAFVVTVAAAAALALLHCGSDNATLAPPPTQPQDAGAEASAPTFCSTATAASFCADFDRGPTPGADFDGLVVTGNGTVSLIDATTTTSKPKAGRCALGALLAGALGADAQLVKKFPLANKKSAVIDFAIRIGDANPSADQLVRYFAFQIDTGSIGLFRDAAKWFLAIHRDNATAADEDEEPVIASIPLDTWLRVRLEMTFGRPGNIRLSIDGQPQLSQAIATHGDAQPLAQATLALGLSRVNGAVPAVAVDFDDVTVQLP